MSSKFLTDNVFSCIERDISHEQSVSWLTWFIAVSIGTLNSLVLIIASSVVSWSGKVNVDPTTVNLFTLQGIVSLSSFCGVDKLYIAKPAIVLSLHGATTVKRGKANVPFRPSGGPVRNNTHTREFTKTGKFSREHFLVHIPREGADKEVFPSSFFFTPANGSILLSFLHR